MKLDVSVETDVSRSPRARQLEGMFDVPGAPHQRQSWQVELPLAERSWNVGLIVGPSGCGKSTLLREGFGGERELSWDSASVVDDFPAGMSIDDISTVCSAVGFNTVPAWLRPYRVLSNGEQFRVSLARRLSEPPTAGPIVVDEFTSVVDRQVAKIGAQAVAKYVRKRGGQFVAASCHSDIIEWLQPDWTLEPATRTFSWRSVQPRPRLDVTIGAIPYAAWELFAPYHYLTASLSRSARCYAAWIDGQPVAFTALLHRPHPRVRDIMGLSRTVTLPDWQGLGLAPLLTDTLASAYKSYGKRVRAYPAHPAYIRTRDRSPVWRLFQRPGYGSSNSRGHVHGPNSQLADSWRAGGRPCAVFEYAGPALPRDEAQALLSTYHGSPK